MHVLIHDLHEGRMRELRREAAERRVAVRLARRQAQEARRSRPRPQGRFRHAPVQ